MIDSAIWHPCSQMKDYELFKPLEVVRTHGSYLELKDGRKVIDAISSWWCKTLGHQHPRLKQAIKAQIEKFEHVILANTTNATIVALSERLTKLTKTLTKVFYASDGSSAIEIAMKMSLQSRSIQDNHQRNFFITLKNAYHGETIGALSVSDLGLYCAPFKKVLFDAHTITPPYINTIEDPTWQNCETHWEPIAKQLAQFADKTTAVIVEPIVQGTGGMRIYSQDFLKRLRAWTKAHDIHLIADEIMTGMGRIGKMLACEYAEIEPDFLCLGKGLTGGWLPMSAVLTSKPIYDLFYDDYETGKSFLHSHTHSGNVLAASLALETLTVIEEENLTSRASQIGKFMYAAMQEIADHTQKLKNIRSIGAIAAADLICPVDKRTGFEVFKKAVSLGAFLRPLGNTLYWLPPLTVDFDTLTQLKLITQQAVVD